FSWGNNQTTYLVSVNNTREEGLVEKTSFNRYGGRFNLNHRTDRFNFGISTTSSYIKDIFVPNGFDVNLRGGAINAAKLYDPTLAIRDEEGNFVLTEFMDIDNPLAILTGNHIDGNRYRYLGTVFAEYFVLPSLSVKVRAGGDANNEDKTVYKDRTTIIGNSLGGVATAYSATQTNYLVEGTLNFNKAFGDHNLGALAGITTQKFMTKFSEQQANNFTTDATLANNFGLADRSTLINNSFKEGNTLLSYLGRVNYKFQDKYLLTASYRIDGSSRFGEGNRFGFFPSFSLGWLIDQESFFPSTDVVDMLKLRGSWGQTGNQEIGNNNSIVTFASGNRTSYVLDDQFVTSLNPTRIANPDLQWETTEQIDIGVDFSLFTGRISGSIDWYQKKTTDMLLNLPIPTSSGFSSKLVNIGSMNNSGFEFALTSYNVVDRGFSWSSDLNFYTLNNEVTELGGISQILTGSFSAAAGNISIITPGEPLRSFYGHEVVGIWQQGDDLSSVTNNVSPGDFKFRDVDGNGTIDGDDRVILGNSFPDFTWGFGNTFKYKGLNLYVFFRGVEGVNMINGNLLEQYFPRSGVRVNRFAEPFLNRWTPTNPTNAQPSYLNVDQLSQGVNSRTVVDASYIKLQTVRLSYTLPTRLIQGTFRSVEVYVTGLNLITFSDYEGYDPALNPNGSANFRIDWNGYPSARTYLFGLNLGF
ncbi:MAG: SusC/RagA family TonB-linked outer membrane protein, partial [Phaeodactylibacter sp.]|nr:SusC/RagA family TonB-linked outer membrane protein [Phaeodactylibacter sp.]